MNCPPARLAHTPFDERVAEVGRLVGDDAVPSHRLGAVQVVIRPADQVFRLLHVFGQAGHAEARSQAQDRLADADGMMADALAEAVAEGDRAMVVRVG